MEYLLEIKLDDKNYNAIVHFVSVFHATSNEEAKVFSDYLVDGFKRNGFLTLSATYTELDSEELKNRQYQYIQFCLSRATATVNIDQFLIKDPNQAKSLAENLTDKVMNGDISTATIGKKYQIPIRVLNKETLEPIKEIYYCNIEQLFPK